MTLVYKDIKTGQATYAKPEKNFPAQIKTLREGLDTVFGRTDVNEQELGETVGQMQIALDGITELYGDLVTTQTSLDSTIHNLGVADESLKSANATIKMLTRANAELSDELELAKIALEEARVETKQNGDALLELFDMLMGGI